MTAWKTRREMEREGAQERGCKAHPFPSVAAHCRTSAVTDKPRALRRPVHGRGVGVIDGQHGSGTWQRQPSFLGSRSQHMRLVFTLGILDTTRSVSSGQGWPGQGSWLAFFGIWFVGSIS